MTQRREWRASVLRSWESPQELAVEVGLQAYSFLVAWTILGRREFHEPCCETVFPAPSFCRGTRARMRVEQRHPISSANSEVELMDLSSHLSRRKPDTQSRRVCKRSIESFARSLDKSRGSRIGSGVPVCHGYIVWLSGRLRSSSSVRAYRSTFHLKWKFKLTTRFRESYPKTNHRKIDAACAESALFRHPDEFVLCVSA
jgi:hypothetical protein